MLQSLMRMRRKESDGGAGAPNMLTAAAATLTMLTFRFIILSKGHQCLSFPIAGNDKIQPLRFLERGTSHDAAPASCSCTCCRCDGCHAVDDHHMSQSHKMTICHVQSVHLPVNTVLHPGVYCCCSLVPPSAGIHIGCMQAKLDRKNARQQYTLGFLDLIAVCMQPGNVAPQFAAAPRRGPQTRACAAHFRRSGQRQKPHSIHVRV